MTTLSNISQEYHFKGLRFIFFICLHVKHNTAIHTEKKYKKKPKSKPKTFLVNLRWKKGI